MVKVAKYKIIKPINTTWEVFGKVLREIKYESRAVLNRTIQYHWDWDNYSSEYKAINKLYPKPKEVLDGRSLGGYIYNRLSSEFNKQQTGNLSITCQNASKKYKDSRLKIFKGEMSIPSYRKNNPIHLHKNSIKLIKEDGKYILRVSLISNRYKKELDLDNGRFDILINEGDSSSKKILDRCISREYDIASSMIVDNDKKWYFSLSYNFIEQKNDNLDKNRILGIDMGIIYPLYFAVNNDFIRGRIDGGEIEQFRKGIERRKNQLLRQGKYCGNGRKGHGIKTRIKPIDFAEKRIAHFRDTCNHKYSRYVVDFAYKNECGTIQMEDLEGISTNNRFLRNWTYLDLQNKIEYKAKELGINVVKVDPKYTSQRCSKCGFIDKNNRPDQATFKCIKCGLDINADYNAALNIATSNIDKIIAQQLEREC